MSNNKDNTDLPNLKDDYVPVFEHCSIALHVQTRQAEQALQIAKTQQANQSKDKPKETKK